MNRSCDSKNADQSLSTSSNKWMNILKELVDMPGLNFKDEEISEMKANFNPFFFFLISCKHEIAKQAYEQITVIFVKTFF